LDNSNLLVQASSGLERLMYENRKGVLKDSTVAQVSAYVYYSASVISKLTTNKQFKHAFTTVIFEQIDKDFGEYIDALARTRPKSLHHVRRHMFINKAEVMERGLPLTIRPKNAERLVFEYNGETIFMPKGASVTVRRPGGSAATNQFNLAHSRFFSGQLVNSSIKKSGFQRLFNSSMTKALSVPSNIKKVQYSFTANTIRSQADSELSLAFGGAL